MTTHLDTMGARAVLSKKGYKNPSFVLVIAVKLSRFKNIFQQAVSLELQSQSANIGQSLKELFLVRTAAAQPEVDIPC